MSEYQYLEFHAIDRPLTVREMDHLRSISTRAQITPVSFINEYSWGGLKADPRYFMRHFFDAHVSIANWGDAIFMVRLPREAIDQKTLKAFCTSPHLEFEKLPEHWLLTWALDAWLDKLPKTEVRGYLRQMLDGQGASAKRALKRRHAAWREQSAPTKEVRRSVAELWQLSEQAKGLRLIEEAKARRLAEAERKRQRDSWLAKLAADFPRAWKTAHDDANKGHAHAYDAACRQLVDLRDAYSEHATLAVFQKEFQKYMAEHSRRRALVQRLVKAGLWRDK